VCPWSRYRGKDDIEHLSRRSRDMFEEDSNVNHQNYVIDRNQKLVSFEAVDGLVA
jgi:hypothetical protein